MVRADSVGCEGHSHNRTGHSTVSEASVYWDAEEVGLCIACGTVVVTLVLEAVCVSYRCETYLQRQDSHWLGGPNPYTTSWVVTCWGQGPPPGNRGPS